MSGKYTMEYTAVLYGPVNIISEAIINAFTVHDSLFYLAEYKQYIHQFLFESRKYPDVKLQVHISEITPGENILFIIVYAAPEQVSKRYLGRWLRSFLRTLLPALAAQSVVVKSTTFKLNMSLFIFIVLVIAMITIIVASIQSPLLCLQGLKCPIPIN